MAQKPSVGRIVHYASYGTPGGEYPKACRAAIITSVECSDEYGDGVCVSLCVLNPTGQFFNEHVTHDPGAGDASLPGRGLCTGLEHDGGTWHWPARA